MSRCTGITLDGNQCTKSYNGAKGDVNAKKCGHHKYQTTQNGVTQCTAITLAGNQCSRSFDTPEGDAVNKKCWQHKNQEKTQENTNVVVKKPDVKKSVVRTLKFNSDVETTLANCLKEAIAKAELKVEQVTNLFLGTYELGNGVYFRNAIGTAKDKRRPQRTWIAFYKEHAGCGISKCSAENCDAVGTDGAHVELRKYKGQYIIPLCRSHNVMHHKKCAERLPKTVFLEPKESQVRHMLLRENVTLVRITPFVQEVDQAILV